MWKSKSFSDSIEGTNRDYRSTEKVLKFLNSLDRDIANSAKVIELEFDSTVIYWEREK
jgi:hypothetical protein